MTDKEREELAPGPGASIYRFDTREFPWWLAGMVLVIVVMVLAISFDSEYREAFGRIFPIPMNWGQGIALTFYLTVGSFV
ncbi:MAG TPA: hypothetical protein VGA97_07545, partial [Acidimicrobiia bacterium]